MKKIIIAPLNWGLGHASRCVPIIHFLLKNNFIPIIASDGAALTFLKHEFPKLEFIELPSYQIKYQKKLQLGLFLQTARLLKIVKTEQQFIESYITENKGVVGIISDNRFGVYSKQVPSVYLTHQWNVLSGITTFITSKIHQYIIQKFDACWIPDTENSDFSGKLSQIKKLKIPVKFIGVLSKFQYKKSAFIYDVLIILSGPEPHRGSLEKKLKHQFKHFQGNVVLVQGVMAEKQEFFEENNLKIYNYVLSEQLEQLVCQSKWIVCRSGYSSIMDLSVMQKQALFIPTPNQAEQEYLANYLKNKKWIPYVVQENFSLACLEQIKEYEGLPLGKNYLSSELLGLFQGKRKF